MASRRLSEGAIQQRGPDAAALAEQRKRVRAALKDRPHALVEDDPARRDGYVARLLQESTDDVGRILAGDAKALAALPPEKKSAAERIQGGTIDFVPAVFLRRGAEVARAVGRVLEQRGGPALGTGFLVAPGVMLTNQHVLTDLATARKAVLEMDYELDARGEIRTTTQFSLDPDRLFVTSPAADLDFALVAVGPAVQGLAAIGDYPYCPLRGSGDKHALGACVNIVQHPDGRPKEVSLRENELVARNDRVLLYEADTLPGSSGSPVFNDLWEIVALHHYGDPSAQIVAPGVLANEGIRISAIVARLESLLPGDGSALHRLLARVLDVGLEPAKAPDAPPVAVATAPAGGGPPPDRRIAYAPTLPSTIVLSSAPSASPEKVTIDEDYTNRRGYDRDFLAQRLELPELTRGQSNLAPLLDDPTESELRYQHFSIVMNKRTRMAFFTAVNIDGASWRDIDRDTGQPKESREAKEVWYVDGRIAAEHQLDQTFFDQTSYLFDRGHLVRRLDPTWGSDRKAVRANADTFHFTNCSPQNWKFNQRATFWQGIEMYLLEHGAVADRERLTVFSGPLFESGMDYRIDGIDLTIPARYFKVVVRVVDGALRASGFVADQSGVINDRRGESIPSRKTIEKYVKEWRHPIADIERLTGLSFGPAAAADTHPAGPGESALGSRKLLMRWEDLLA